MAADPLKDVSDGAASAVASPLSLASLLPSPPALTSPLPSPMPSLVPPVPSPAVAGVVQDDATAWALAARDGDPTAAAAFIRATQAEVWRFVAAMVDPGSADDLTQETFLRALRASPGCGDS